jgi:heptosyltransferase III
MRLPSHILLSRTDNIGDVVLTLPMAGVIKQHFPKAELSFLGKEHTRPLIEACRHIDHFLDIGTFGDSIDAIRAMKIDTVIHVFPRRDIAALTAKAGIPHRVGTTGRLYHWFSCNHLVPLTRRRSRLHEAQLNLILLSGLGINKLYSLQEIPGLYGLTRIPPLKDEHRALLDRSKCNLILHPLSSGSGREWGLDNFRTLATLLPPEAVRIFITGTEKEGETIRSSGILDLPEITDLTGRFTLEELISFIAAVDALVAASTGPLHLAAALGKRAIGIYPPIQPMHPGRWAPLGERADSLVIDRDCSDCRNGGACACMHAIKPYEVARCLLKNET